MAAAPSPYSLKTFANPSAHPRDVAVGSGPLKQAAGARLEILDMCHLRINQEADHRRECGALRRFGQTLDAERTPDTNLSLKNAPCSLGQAHQLACATRQNDPPSRLSCEARILEAISNEFEDLLDTRTDDPHEMRFRQMVRNVAFVLIHLRDRDHVAIVRAR